ncbi:cation channel sperm-associated targeting subunit tau [Erinaceus europaeus]|uniref:Cation channel sperm-associated targeting subunit tau n=1 Tax=Erinaceus europaeus TaxID=9365 RepID=A0ABM3XMU3_ERIEU|nr:cation channel sperm-associated targeting subunit tau [Erinaceus europaeus]
MELHHEKAKSPSTVGDVGSGRVHLQHSSAVLQGSANISIAALKAKESENRGLELSMDEAKEDAAHKLLSMMRKNTKGLESKGGVQMLNASTLVPFGDVVGCLAIHIRNCRDISSRLNLPDYSNLFIRISINNIVKCTKVHQLTPRGNETAVIAFEDMKYFSVQVPRRQNDERNNIYFDLMKYDDQDYEPFLLGSAGIHLYEVIQKGCFLEELSLMNASIFVCRLQVEFMFSYGNFGYGFSHQLKPLQKVIEPSMFMNVPPPPERTDPMTNIITPQPIEYPAFLSSDLNITVGRPSTAPQPNLPSTVQLEKLRQKPRERLKKLRKEYRDLGTWMEKASYLEKILAPKLEHTEPKKSDADEELEDVKPEDTTAIDDLLDRPLEGRPEDYVVSDVPLIEEKPTTIPYELPYSGHRKSLTVPTSLQPDQDLYRAVAPKMDGSRKQADTPLPIITKSPSKEDRKPSLEGQLSQVKPERKPTDKPKDKYPNIVTTDSSLSEPGALSYSGLPEPETSIPRTGLLEPRTSLLEPRTSLLEPGTGLLEPGTGLLEPGTALLEPGTGFREPGTGFREPRTTLREPRAGLREPEILEPQSAFGPTNMMDEKLDFPHVDKLKLAKTNAQKNTNKKGKSVAFVPREDSSPYRKRNYIQLKPKYQDFTIKDVFEPFLRKIDTKTPVIAKKNQEDMFKCKINLSTDSIDYEDQDPPYPAHADSARPTTKVRDKSPSIILIKPLDTKDKSAPDTTDIPQKTSTTDSKLAQDSATSAKTVGSNESVPNIIVTPTKISSTEAKLAQDPFATPVKMLDIKLKERPPNVSLPDLERESSLNGNINALQFSRSVSLASQLEKLKQSLILKSLLSKNFQDLSDKLFSELEVPMATEAREKSRSSLRLIHDELSGDLKDKIPVKSEELTPWNLARDISQFILSQVSNDLTANLFSRKGSGTFPEVERELISDKSLETDEVHIPTKRKSSFKKKHLESEVPRSKSGLNGFTHDDDLKQIFTAPILSEIGVRQLSEMQMDFQHQLPTVWENVSSNSLAPHEENKDEIKLPPAKSVISQMIQTFPVDTLLDSGIIKVVELDKEDKSLLPGTEIPFIEDNSRGLTEDNSKYFSEQNIFMIPREITSSLDRVEVVGKSQDMSSKDSKYRSTPDKEPHLPSSAYQFGRKGKYRSSPLERLSDSVTDTHTESDVAIIKSFLRNIFNVFFKYNQPERRQPEKELKTLINHPFLGTKDLEEIEESLDNIGRLGRKPLLSPKLRVFLKELSEPEVKNVKSELSKYIQHYLVERLSESGHITKEDLPKIYHNLYLMNEKAEPKGQMIFLEKYSGTINEIISFVNNFSHNFIDKHLEIKLRSFLSELLQNYFLNNLSGSSLFKERKPETVHSNISSLRTKSASISFHELGHDISKGTFGRKLEIDVKYSLNKSLQNYLVTFSENELSAVKVNLRKYLCQLFIEKLSRSGLISERQLERTNQPINLVSSSTTFLKSIKPDLSYRDEDDYMEKDLKEQNENSKVIQKTKAPEDRLIEIELTRKEEKAYFSKDPSAARESKRYQSPEAAKSPSLVKEQTSSNKNTEPIPVAKSLENLADTLRKKRKEHGFLQFTQAEKLVVRTEIQDPHSWGNKSTTPHTNACFERTCKAEFLETKEKPEEVLLLYPQIINCKMQNEAEEYVNKVTSPSRQTYTHFNSESGEKSKLDDQYCQRLKGNNNNNKKRLATLAQNKKERPTLHLKQSETCVEKYSQVPELQPLKYEYGEIEKISKPSFFPEVSKTENLKVRVQKEKDHVGKQKKSFNKVDRLLPTALPSTRVLKKSVPKTMLHWTARTTIHDCLDRFEEPHMDSFPHLEKTKSRSNFLRKSPVHSRHQVKHSARPYTAPEINKRRENYTGKLMSPRQVSAGIVHTNDSVPGYELHKMWQRRLKKEH